jgi:FkbM family methyltransferase
MTATTDILNETLPWTSHTCSEKRIIYDFGANNGDDIPYYLLKADLVVAIEANPNLCQSILKRYAVPVGEGRLIVENCIVQTTSQTYADFYIPRPGIPGLSDHHSTFVNPDALPEPFKGRSKYMAITIKARRASEIVAYYGNPYYIKVDIEHSDAEILSELFSAGVHPAFISAEAHTINVFAQLVACGSYRQFKLVDGLSVPAVYSGRFFCAESGSLLRPSNEQSGAHHPSPDQLIRVKFPHGSAGPFGDDIDGEWLSSDDFIHVLARSGLGWKDIHAKGV